MRRNLTVKSIDALQPASAGGRYDVADAIVPGFGVRVTDKGNKSYTLTARFPGSGNPTRRTIGTIGAIDLAQAREMARAWLIQIQAGIDPRAERACRKTEAAMKPHTFAEVVGHFMMQHVRRTGLRSGNEIQRIFDKDLLPNWRNRDFTSIRRGDVARLLDEIEARAPVHADHILAVLSKLCNWYMAREESYTSPIVRGMRRTNAHERARNRVLNDEEIRLFWQVSNEAGPYGAFLRTCLLTGQRRAKIREIKWGDIDDSGVWTISAEAREKTNAKSLKLPRQALDLIQSQPKYVNCDTVFAGRGNVPINGFSKAKRLFDIKMTAANGTPIAPWTVHDLRRTARSLMSRAGVRPDVCERVLGHAIQGVEGVYDRYSYDKEKGQALQKLSDLIGQIVA